MATMTFDEGVKWLDETGRNVLPNEVKLTLVGLAKQGKEGDVNTTRPGMMDVKGRMKWDAWNSRKGMSQDDAKAEFLKVLAQNKP